MISQLFAAKRQSWTPAMNIELNIFQENIFVSRQGRAPPSTRRLTSPPRRRPTRWERSTPWVGRRACTLWSWEEKGRHIDSSITELLIPAGRFCQRRAHRVQLFKKWDSEKQRSNPAHFLGGKLLQIPSVQSPFFPDSDMFLYSRGNKKMEASLRGLTPEQHFNPGLLLGPGHLIKRH